MSQARRPPPSECAQCGATIPPQALACPQCGADDCTGWRESSVYDGLELPDEAWNENGDAAPPHAPERRVNGIAWYWWCLAVAVLIIAGMSLLSLR